MTGGRLMSRNSDGLLVFDKQFEKSKIDQYDHYWNKENQKLVQISNDSKLVGIHSPPFNEFRLNPFTEDEMMEILKNLVINRMPFKLLLDVSDYDLEYFMEYGILEQMLLTSQEYINLLEGAKDEFLPVLMGVLLIDNSKKLSYRIEILPSGSISYKEFLNADLIPDTDIIKLLFKICGYPELYDAFELVNMVEKPIVPSPYSKLYVLMDYIEAHRDTLPHQVAEALGYAGLEESLKQLAETNKNKSQYKN